MIVFAVAIIEYGTGVHWRIVMLIAFIGILRNVGIPGPKDIKYENLIQIPNFSRFVCKLNGRDSERYNIYIDRRKLSVTVC